MANSDLPWTFLVPGDPDQRTGGYGYGREIVAGLQQLGQPVALTGLAGAFPRVDRQAQAALDDALSALPDGASVVVDGLALGGCPQAALKHGYRLNLVALVHHPLADETGLSKQDRDYFFETERLALSAVKGVITTSDTTAAGLSRYDVPAPRITTVPPGVHRPEPTPPAPSGPLRILCLAHLSPRKAQHHLVEALARLPASDWRCELAGSAERDPAYAAEVKQQIDRLGLTEQVHLTGELSGEALAQSFQQANLFVLPSVYEGYGMVIDEALANGLPVLSSDGGALAITANRAGCTRYPAGDIDALSERLLGFQQQPEQISRQQQAARHSANGLRSWQQAAREFQQAVDRSLPDGSDFDAGWLALREPADHEARSDLLTRQAVNWLWEHGGRAPVIADIGAGTGSNWRYFSRALAAGDLDQCRWHLFDQDATLLKGFTQGASGPTIHIERLGASNLGQRLPRQLSLLTASALIDLVSPDWLEAFASAASARQAAVLVVLSYAGQFRLTPGHLADGDLREQVNRHQHGDKGTGGACGPEASDYLARALERQGYSVRLEPSVWRLDSRHSQLQESLMQGWVDAARSQLASADIHAPGSDWLDQWLADRRAQVKRGELLIEVDHVDMLGVPLS